MAYNDMYTKQIFTAEAIDASGIAFATALPIRDRIPEGYFSLQLALTGDGTCKLEWLVSADGKKYIAPTGFNNIICSGFTKASGSHPLEVGDSIFVFGVSGMVEINEGTGTVAGISATTITTDIDSSGYSAYTSGGTVRVPAKEVAADTVITGITKADPAVITVNRGNDVFSMSVPPMPYLKIKATETGGANSITISAWLTIL